MSKHKSIDDFMEDALFHAKEANKINEVPVGCVFVYNNEIIATGCNLVNETKNATRHAEFVCIDKTLEFCKTNNYQYNEVFSEISVIVSVEPCIMCLSALNNLNVKQIVYGCKNDRFGGQTVVDVKTLLNSNIIIKGGVREDEAMALLKVFYKGENPSAPKPKTKT